MCPMMLAELETEVWVGTILGVWAVVILLAWVPGSIARRNRHPNPEGVNQLALFGLLLPLLWPAAMIWAIVGGKPRKSGGHVSSPAPQTRSSFMNDDDDEAMEFEIMGTDESGKRVQWTMLAEDSDAARFAAFERNITVIAVRRSGPAGAARRGRTASDISWEDEGTSRPGAKAK